MIASATIPEEAIGFPLICGPVVYFLMLGDECVYVGSTCQLATRIGTHLATKRPAFAFNHVRYINVEKSQLNAVEKHWIRALRPRFNINGRLLRSMIQTKIDGGLGKEVGQYMERCGFSLGNVIERAIRLLLEADGWPMKSVPDSD